MSSTPFQEKAERVREVIKAFLQSAPLELQTYMFDYMGEDIGAQAFRDTEKGSALSLRGVPVNKTDKLRIQTTRLSSAFTPNKNGNVTIVAQKDGQIYLLYGIDLKKVPYARIHELGGKAGRGGAVKIEPRPYLKPGFEDFLDKQVPRFLKRIQKAIED